MKEITSDVTLMDTSHCHVQHSCLSSCICDILLPAGSHSLILSQVFARFSHVSFKCLLGLSFPRSKKDDEDCSVQKEKLCFAAVPLILEKFGIRRQAGMGCISKLAVKAMDSHIS